MRAQGDPARGGGGQRGTPRGRTGGWSATQAADLTAIRRTDAVIDLVATRRLRAARALGGAEVSLLSSLAADVDSPPARCGVRPAACRGSHGARTWMDAAAALFVVTVAALLAAGLVAAGMLTRLGGGSAPRGPRRPGQPRS